MSDPAEQSSTVKQAREAIDHEARCQQKALRIFAELYTVPLGLAIDAAIGMCYIAASIKVPESIISPIEIIEAAMPTKEEQPDFTYSSIAASAGLATGLCLAAYGFQVWVLEECCTVNRWAQWKLGFAPSPKKAVKDKKGKRTKKARELQTDDDEL